MFYQQALLAGLLVLASSSLFGQAPPATEPQPQQEEPAPEEPVTEKAPEPATDQRTQLNLARQTNSAGGESQRNENNRVNPLDTATERELTRRVGATATIVQQFQADRNYFASEYGRSPEAPIHITGANNSKRLRGTMWENHENSITSARSFFQVGGVLPARDNDYGLRLQGPLWKNLFWSADAAQQKSRGMVNGNVLVPKLDERTPLTTDPKLYSLIQNWMAAYPATAPNLPYLDPRALNTNAPQRVDTNSFGGRVDTPIGRNDAVALRWATTVQDVKAFQLVKGQNPDSDVHNHRGTATWRKTISPRLLATFSGVFDRTTTSIRPDATSPDYRVNTNNVLQTIGNDTDVPARRIQNLFRYAGALEGSHGDHRWRAGGEMVRQQVNSQEQEFLRGVVTFQSAFGNDALTNLRRGLATNYQQTIGDTYRGYRIRKWVAYVDDQWKVNEKLNIHIGLRWEPMQKPTEVNRRETMPFGCACGTLAPRFGWAYRLPKKWGVLRAAYSMDYGQLFAATFGQMRMNVPNAARISNNSPNLLNPLNGITVADLGPNFRSSYFDIASNLGLPYEHTYNFSWEWKSSRGMQLQLGYVGSRAHRLFETLYNNRAAKLADVTKMTTGNVNERRPDLTKYDVLRIHNGAKSYFDAARVTLSLPPARGFGFEVSYWFSKAIDFGTDYTSTVAGSNNRQGRSPSQFFVHDTMKGLSSFDQPHALIVRGNYQTPRIENRLARAIVGRWNVNSVWLLKSGTPFTLETGADGPGFGNVDGQQSDRPMLVDPSILGRIIGNPDKSEKLMPRSAFAYITPDQYTGNLGRNVFRRGKITNVNASVERNWTLPHEWALQLRAESVNMFNTPQFDTPVITLSSPVFAKITNTLNGGRVFHFRLQLQF